MAEEEQKFNEAKAVAEAKEHLLSCIKDRANNVNPSVDALNYAAAYAHLVNAEKNRQAEPKNNVEHK